MYPFCINRPFYFTFELEPLRVDWIPLPIGNATDCQSSGSLIKSKFQQVWFLLYTRPRPIGTDSWLFRCSEETRRCRWRLHSRTLPLRTLQRDKESGSNIYCRNTITLTNYPVLKSFRENKTVGKPIFSNVKVCWKLLLLHAKPF